MYTERAFAVFMAGLRPHLERLVVAGRLEPEPGRWHYRLPAEVEFVALPHYRSLSHPLDVGRALAGSIRSFWGALRSVDAVWLLGPHPLALLFAALAVARGRRVALGVRQDLPSYASSRHPGRRSMRLAVGLLEGAYRLLGRACPVVVVGPDLAQNYRHSRRLLEIGVSLVRDQDIAAPEVFRRRSYEGQLTALSVGRLEAEKNPLLLAEILRLLRETDPRWRLAVYGEGPMRDDLEARLRELGLDGHAELRGYVPVHAGLLDVYRNSHAFLHVSWTEGLPQVLFEAFAARLPVVATAVGGVPSAAAEAALLVEPGDAGAAAGALAAVAGDEQLRARLVESGIERVRARTLDAECRRVVRFLEDA